MFKTEKSRLALVLSIATLMLMLIFGVLGAIFGYDGFGNGWEGFFTGVVIAIMGISSAMLILVILNKAFNWAFDAEDK